MTDTSHEKRPKKRVRLTLVCEPCKRKKIKCDKDSPCSACVKAKIQDQCIFNNTVVYAASAGRPISMNVKSDEIPKQSKQKHSDHSLPQNGLQNNLSKQQSGNDSSSNDSNSSAGNSIGNNSNAFGNGSNGNDPNQSLLPNKRSPGQGSVRSLGSFDSHQGIYNSEVMGSVNRPTPPLLSNYSPQDMAMSPRNSLTGRNMFSPRFGFPGSIPAILPSPNRTPAMESLHTSKPSVPSVYEREGVVKRNRDEFTAAPSHTASSSELKSLSGSNSWFTHTPSITSMSDSSGSIPSPMKRNKSPIFSRDRTNFQSLVGVNPIASIYDEIEYSCEKSPFSKSYLSKTEPALACLSQYIHSESGLRATSEQINNSFNSAKNAPMADSATNTLYIQLIKQSFQRVSAQGFGLEQKILLMLPPRDNTWLLVERYFRYAYPWSPVLDEREFMNRTCVLIGPKSVTDHSKIEHLNFSDPIDYLVVGQLLVVLRMAYTTLFKNKESENIELLNNPNPSPSERTVQFLMKTPIHLNMVEVANECLEKYLANNTERDVAVLQLMFMIRVYYRYAPEVYNSSDVDVCMLVDDALIDMAYAVGAPNANCSLDEPPKVHLKNKLWHCIKACDVFSAYYYGVTPKIDSKDACEHVPEVNEDNSNLIDHHRDKEISAMLFRWFPVIQKLQQLTLTLMPKESKVCKIAEVVTDLNEFEQLCWSGIFNIDEFFEPPYTGEMLEDMRDSDRALATVHRNMCFKFFISTNSILSTIYFNLHLHYSSVGNCNLSYFYLKKTMIVLGDVAPILFRLLAVKTTYSDYIYSPSLQSHLDRTHEIFQSLIVRFSFVLHHNKHNNNLLDEEQEYFSLMTSLRDSMIAALEMSIKLINKLSHRYFYSWRLSKSDRFFLKIIKSDDFYNTVLSSRDNKFKKDLSNPRLTRTQLQELSQIFSQCHQMVSLTEEGAKVINERVMDEISANTDEASDIGSFEDMDFDSLWLDLFHNNSSNDATLFDLFSDIKFDSSNFDK